MSFKMLQLGSVTKQLVDTLIDIKPWEHVLIVTDPTVDASVDNAMAGAFRAAGAEEVYVLTISPREVSNARPPAVMREALKVADVYVMHMRYDIQHPFEVYAAKVDNGMRTLYMPALRADQMIHRMVAGIDHEALKKYDLDLGIKMYGDVKTLRITDKLGTDFTTDVKGAELGKYNQEALKKPITLCREPGGMVVLPAGGTEVDVVPFTANGVVVFEAYHMFGRLNTPIRLTLKDGYVTNVDGGYEARILRKLFKEKQDSDYLLHIGGPGTNPYCRCPGLPELIEDKHSEGPQHVGFGGGAKLTSEMHSDGIVYKPTIEADGKIVQEDGVIKFPLFQG